MERVFRPRSSRCLFLCAGLNLMVNTFVILLLRAADNRVLILVPTSRSSVPLLTSLKTSLFGYLTFKKLWVTFFFFFNILRYFSPPPNSQGFMILALLYVKIYAVNPSYALASPISQIETPATCNSKAWHCSLLSSFVSKGFIEKLLIISLLLILASFSNFWTLWSSFFILSLRELHSIILQLYSVIVTEHLRHEYRHEQSW